MKLKSILTLLALVATMLTFTTLPAMAAPCSQFGVAGDYGYSFSGFVATPTGTFVPAAGAGRITFDRHGNVTGTQTRSLAGSALDETFSGSYTVNADCTGSFTVVVQPDTRTSVVNLVWTDDTNGVSAVFTNPGFVIAVTARRLHPRN